MVARTGLFIAPVPGTLPVGTSPTDGRLVLGALFGVGPGCLSGGAMTASATLMQVVVAAAVWRIPDPTNAAAVYLSPTDPVTLTFSAGPASGSRIDTIQVRQNNYEAGDADSRVIISVKAGTASATPTAPAPDAGAMKIGQLTVPTGAANAAAGTLVTPFGGQTIAPPMLIVATEAQLPPAGAHIGQLALVSTVTLNGTTAPIVERWSGTAWKRWDSDWIAATFGVGGVNGPYGASPGWTTQGASFRYASGQVRYRGNFSLNGGTAATTGQLAVAMPVNASTAVGAQFPGTVFGINSSDNNQPWVLGTSGSSTYLYFSVQTVVSGNNGKLVAATGSAPFGEPWAAGDTVTWDVTYDPA